MTPQDPVEGGLAEPAELEPDQGTLALALPGPAATRADWEKAAAGVLRKAGRLREDDPDDAVWAALTRTTLDGVGGQPARYAGAHRREPAATPAPPRPAGATSASSCAVRRRSS